MTDATLKPIPGCPSYFAGSDGTIWSAMPGRGGRYKVLEILARLRAGESGADLAKEFGIGTGAISHLKTGRTWRHLAAASSEGGVH